MEALQVPFTREQSTRSERAETRLAIRLHGLLQRNAAPLEPKAALPEAIARWLAAAGPDELTSLLLHATVRWDALHPERD